jgi:hypothetical protein
MSVSPGASGIFEDTTSSTSRDVDFDYKTACFYVDWDSSYNIPKFAIPADKHQLKDNIGYFRKETKKLVW